MNREESIVTGGARALSLFGKLLLAAGLGLIALGGLVIASKWWTYYTDPASMAGHGWAISPILFFLGGIVATFGGAVCGAASWLGDRDRADSDA